MKRAEWTQFYFEITLFWVMITANALVFARYLITN